MSNKEMVSKMVKGEMTNSEAEQLYNRLNSRSEREIIDDLKELDFENLINTEECLEDFLDTMSELEDSEENKRSIESTEKALEYLKIAIKERMKEMIAAEHKLKELVQSR
ncbi:hypothetical protein [Inconstantimicrobium mannanitabidum]|uniref:Uncharacterized protein n=1 Tax=Inconstantimicrobium mannanitabidum TaxID=1604901 RepID=A0ACB5R9K7_9CLOT|nr:hypothetical protein [Clostridium sp. TW13]GKX65817.1 hypothetical protein rsdtw13_10750 [Clostridium sp. TW13]